MAIANRTDILSRLMTGKSFRRKIVTGSAAATTAAVFASGGLTTKFHFNAIGSTLPTTTVGIPLAPGPVAEALLAHLHVAVTSGLSIALVRLYELGTLNLAATGNQFTPAAGITFPLLRTVFGAASQPISLVPMLYITTATTTTAAVVRLQTATGTAGYVNQAGTSVIGTVTWTAPAAATAVQSGFMLPLNDGDVGVRSISQIRVDTAAAAGAARVYGVEILAGLGTVASQFSSIYDFIFGQFAPVNLNPAVATAGTVTSHLAVIGMNRTAGGELLNVSLEAVLND